MLEIESSALRRDGIASTAGIFFVSKNTMVKSELKVKFFIEKRQFEESKN